MDLIAIAFVAIQSLTFWYEWRSRQLQREIHRLWIDAEVRHAAGLIDGERMDKIRAVAHGAISDDVRREVGF